MTVLVNSVFQLKVARAKYFWIQTITKDPDFLGFHPHNPLTNYSQDPSIAIKLIAFCTLTDPGYELRSTKHMPSVGKCFYCEDGGRGGVGPTFKGDYFLNS